MNIKFITEQKIGKKFDDARSIKPNIVGRIRLRSSNNLSRAGMTSINSRNKKLKDGFNIKSIMNKSGDLSADRLMNQHFNIGDYDVFISHSSKNMFYAKELQKILAYKGKTSFIDSCVWDNVYQIGDHLKAYGYNPSQVDGYLSVILAHSLTKIMNKARKVIFIASEESLTMNIDQLFNQTYSPWIFHELSMLNLLPSIAMQEAYRTSIEGYNNTHNFANSTHLGKSLEMTFNVELPDFIVDGIDLDGFLE